MFDTLEYYEDLKKAGLADAVASAIAHGQHRFAEARLVSRAHFDATIGRLEGRISGLEAKLDFSLSALDAKIGSVRREMRALVGGLYLYVTLAIAIMATLTHLHII